MVRHDGAASRPGSSDSRAERESSAEPRALNAASQDCTDATEPPHARAGRFIFENRTEHSFRSEKAALLLRPPTKARSGLSAELDGAMTRLGITNEAIAKHLGVSEKLVREWRGRLPLPQGEEPKAIPGFQIARLPDALFDEMLIRLRLVHRDEQRDAKKAVGR